MGHGYKIGDRNRLFPAEPHPNPFVFLLSTVLIPMSTKPKRRGRTALSETAFFLVAFAGMIASIIGAERLVDSGLVSREVGFQIKELTTYLTKVGLVMITVWLFSRVGFLHSIGRGFQDRFDAGWQEMSNAESTKWMIVILLVLLISASLLMLSN